MRTRALVVTAVSALVLVATPSSAAPQRSITLTPDARTTSWTSDLRIGPYIGSPVNCDRKSLGCETTLIRLTRAGALTVIAAQRVPRGNAEGGGLNLSLFQSGTTGDAGEAIGTQERRSGATASISARWLAAGYYLLKVSWRDLTLGDYKGTANYLPR